MLKPLFSPMVWSEWKWVCRHTRHTGQQVGPQPRDLRLTRLCRSIKCGESGWGCRLAIRKYNVLTHQEVGGAGRCFEQEAIHLQSHQSHQTRKQALAPVWETSLACTQPAVMLDHEPHVGVMSSNIASTHNTSVVALTRKRLSLGPGSHLMCST